MLHRWASLSAFFLLMPVPARADEFPLPRLADVDPAGIPGALVICGGGELPAAAIERFIELAGGEDARLVVIPTAADGADDGDRSRWTAPWRERGVASVTVLHTRSREIADTDEFVAPLKSATAVWFGGGQQSRIADVFVGTRVEQELNALLRRGGVIGGTSAGAAIQSRLMIASGNPDPVLMRGLDLLPGAVIDQHFKARDRQPRLTGVLDTHPGYFGMGIDEGTALIVTGRRCRVVGASSVTVCLAASAGRPERSYELTDGDVADLTAIRRSAIARAQTPFPPDEPVDPVVEQGALFIVGGGGFDNDMLQEFIELAGGDEARIVVVPTADEDPSVEDNRDASRFLRAGVDQVTVLHTTDRATADSAGFVEPLDSATGVWFGGGRQWRLVDAYEGTRTQDAFHGVLRRGGVIGGSSAGATIQGDYLVRGNPLGNRDMMAEGYERGFAFLPGAAIDQHFSQRERHADMQSLKEAFPQLLGLGIDESTALIVQESSGSVVGAGNVYFYDTRPDEDGDRPEYTLVKPGETYDLRLRQRIE